ncbi:MAG: sugar ABC transporter permease, partial [Streptomyces sp.]|nr:sugar ABC transporter permease [Streptomyces sp.]
MTVTHSSAGSVRGRPRGTSRQSRAGMAFVAGYVLLLIAFGVLPTCYAIYFAFTNAGGAFTGLSNFVTTAQDFRFVDSLGHVALYLVFWLLSLVVFVVVLALLLHKLSSGPVSQALRFLYYI